MSTERPPEARAGARERIRAYLERAGLSSQTCRVVPLTGDASDRRYFRVIPGSGDSFVLAVHTDPFDYKRLPFVNVAELLGLMSIPVPAILGHEDDLGILVLEDLGDVTLQARLGGAPATDRAALYRQAVGLIAALQRRGSTLASPKYVPYGIAFDVEKLTWELNFFVKHFLDAYRGMAVAPTDREALAAEFCMLVEELAAQPRVLCHRDYHSRNLMIHKAQLYVIDFQDARMGPNTYDLVSLLRDSYADLREEEVDDLVAYFLAIAGVTEHEREFRRRFDLMALQRNLKALGTFGYQTTACRNPVYIQYIPRTLRYVRENLARHARFARLRAVLATYLDELN